MTLRKQQTLQRLLDEWPVLRTWATVRQVPENTGFLLHVSIVLRPGKGFVERLLAAVGVPKAVVMSSRVSNPSRRVVLSPEFHADLDFWRWLVVEGLDARGGQLCSPMHNIVPHPPQRTLFSDASKSAVGGYCVDTGRYWRYDLTTEQKSRFCGSSKHIVGMQDISINVLELLGMVVSAWLLFVVGRLRPEAVGDCVLLRGDNEAAVAWIARCRGGKEPRSGALMRLLGMLEVSSGWHFQATHVTADCAN